MADEASRADAEFISVTYDPRWTNRKPKVRETVEIFDATGEMVPWAKAALPAIAERLKGEKIVSKTDLAMRVYKELNRLGRERNG